MRERSLRGVASVPLATLLTMGSIGGAGAVTAITSCGTLTVFGEVYKVAADLTSCGTCLTDGQRSHYHEPAGPQHHRELRSGSGTGCGPHRDLRRRGRPRPHHGARTVRSRAFCTASTWSAPQPVAERQVVLERILRDSARPEQPRKGCSATDNGFHGVSVAERSEVRDAMRASMAPRRMAAMASSRATTAASRRTLPTTRPRRGSPPADSAPCPSRPPATTAKMASTSEPTGSLTAATASSPRTPRTTTASRDTVERPAQ